MIRMDIAIDLEYQVLEPAEFIFKIHAADTRRQKVAHSQLTITPDTPFMVQPCRAFGNQHLRLHAVPGPLNINYSATIEINHYLADPAELQELPVEQLPIDVLQYLAPSRYCPSDKFFQVALAGFGHMPKGYSRVQAVCDWVRKHTRFQPGTTTSLNCAMDTYNEGVGVCRDFAHLAIALCRALNIPARYVTSFDHGSDPAFGPPDFHAYVEVYLSGRWYMFDPTGMATVTGLVRLATGRDANDVAFSTIFGQAMWTMPKVSTLAREDVNAGIIVPAPTDMAVSTSGAVNDRQAQPSTAQTERGFSTSWYQPPQVVVPTLTENAKAL
ncbi:MAG: transglutaminase family protein [Burkholderiales bacterium]